MTNLKLEYTGHIRWAEIKDTHRDISKKFMLGDTDIGIEVDPDLEVNKPKEGYIFPYRSYLSQKKDPLFWFELDYFMRTEGLTPPVDPETTELVEVDPYHCLYRGGVVYIEGHETDYGEEISELSRAGNPHFLDLFHEDEIPMIKHLVLKKEKQNEQIKKKLKHLKTRLRFRMLKERKYLNLSVYLYGSGMEESASSAEAGRTWNSIISFRYQKVEATRNGMFSCSVSDVIKKRVLELNDLAVQTTLEYL